MSGLGTAIQPMRTVMPQMGVNYGVDLANEIQAGSVLGGTAGSSVGFLSPDVLQEADVVLTAAQIISMYTTPIQIIPAPPTGQSILVDKVLYRFKYTTPQFTGGATITLQYGNTAHAGGTVLDGGVSSTPIKAAASSDYMSLPIAVAPAQATAVFVSTATAFATGTASTLEIKVWYKVY